MNNIYNGPDEGREAEIVKALMSHVRSGSTAVVDIPRERRLFVSIPAEDLKPVLTFAVRELGFGHLSTITGLDLEDRMEVIYHLNDGETALSLKVPVWRDDPRLPTVVDILPGAALYEREVHELFGIVFEGHPDLAPLLLPEDWPEGLYPMRKNLTPELIRGVLADARATRQSRR